MEQRLKLFQVQVEFLVPDRILFLLTSSLARLPRVEWWLAKPFPALHIIQESISALLSVAPASCIWMIDQHK